MIKNCQYCNKQFEPKFPNQKFCSELCQQFNLKEVRRERYRNPLPKITHCLQCGKPLEGHYKKFCSPECIVEHRKSSRRKTDRRCNPVEKPEVLKKCLLCGADIHWDPKHASTYSRKKFCSRECCAQYFRIHNDNFKDTLFRIGDFKISIKKTNNQYTWEALKNDKVVLKSERSFIIYLNCLKDARLAFK